MSLWRPALHVSLLRFRNSWTDSWFSCIKRLHLRFILLIYLICVMISWWFYCIYAWLDPGAYMIARFMSFINRVWHSSTHRFPPRPWMVARDSSRIFPNIIDPFDWFIPSLLDELVHRAASTTSCMVAPRVVSSRPRAWHTSGDTRIRFQQVRSVRPGPI
jgi:hypothetical protein